MALIDRGDVFDADIGAAGPHPVVVVTRQTAIEYRSNVTVALVTSVVRGFDAEVALEPSDGIDRECVVNCDEIHTIRKAHLTRRRGRVAFERMRAIDDALRLSLGLDGP
jgi:mRNA interferase MazF